MANRKFWFGTLAIALTFTAALAGCNESLTGGNDGLTGCGGDEGKRIIVTGITGKTGEAAIIIADAISDVSEEHVFAMGTGTILFNSVTFNLRKFNGGNPWTGSGSFYLALMFEDSSQYIYTNGLTEEQLGIEPIHPGVIMQEKTPKYDVLSATSTIAFNKFIDIYVPPISMSCRL
jgi:hypothetical protein